MLSTSSSLETAAPSFPLTRSTDRPVAIWVYTGVVMLLIQIILGGITRLTGSGLSITEWNVVTGTLPPLTPAQWLDAFDKYRQTPQFRILNSDFTLSQFKFIFFWEWFHRCWARMVGVVFIVGFIGLLWKRKMKSAMVRPLIILFLLGALQGAIGWIMVASGLTGDAIYVRPAKLALHFVFALGLIAYAFWFALQLSVPPGARLSGSSTHRGSKTYPAGRRSAQRPLYRWTIVILAALVFQLLYGALMAGHKAAAVAPTWPTINGSWVPASLFGQHPLQDAVGNPITVHFIHRTLAFILLILVIGWSLSASGLTGPSVSATRLPVIPTAFRRLRWLPLSLLCLQIVLGISTLLTSPGIIPQHWVPFDWLAICHQVTGLLLLLTMIGMLYLVIPVRHSVTV